MIHPMPPDAPARIKAQAIKQDSDPAVKLRHLIQCHANPGARWTERCLELVDELVSANPRSAEPCPEAPREGAGFDVATSN